MDVKGVRYAIYYKYILERELLLLRFCVKCLPG